MPTKLLPRLTGLLPGVGLLGWLFVLASPAGCGEAEPTDQNGSAVSTSGTGGTGGTGGMGGIGGMGGMGGSDQSCGPFADTPTVLIPRSGIEAHEVAILINDQDPLSVSIGEHYRAARGIPEANVITLSFSTGTVLSQAAFATVKTQLDAALDNQIQALALTWASPYRVACMSITSAFALGFDMKYCNQTTSNCGMTTPTPYYNSLSTRPYLDYGIRPAMSIAAETLDEAKALIARGIAADNTFPMGDGYMIRTTDQARSSRYMSFEGALTQWDHPEGLTLSYIDNSQGTGLDYIENVDDVLFYLTGLIDVPAIDTNNYLPGAVADHLTSFGGRLTNSSQMSALRWLEAGATASYGTVVEPCNYPTKFPNPQVLMPHYFRGQTVIEAYWKSVFRPGEGIFIGEPLARPWGGHEITISDREIKISTTLLKPGSDYRIGAAESADGPFDIIADGISIDDYQRYTISFAHCGASVYKLMN